MRTRQPRSLGTLFLCALLKIVALVGFPLERNILAELHRHPTKPGYLVVMRRGHLCRRVVEAHRLLDGVVVGPAFVFGALDGGALCLFVCGRLQNTLFFYPHVFIRFLTRKHQAKALLLPCGVVRASCARAAAGVSHPAAGRERLGAVPVAALELVQGCFKWSLLLTDLNHLLVLAPDKMLQLGLELLHTFKELIVQVVASRARLRRFGIQRAVRVPLLVVD